MNVLPGLSFHWPDGHGGSTEGAVNGSGYFGWVLLISFSVGQMLCYTVCTTGQCGIRERADSDLSPFVDLDMLKPGIPVAFRIIGALFRPTPPSTTQLRLACGFSRAATASYSHSSFIRPRRYWAPSFSKSLVLWLSDVTTLNRRPGR